MKLAALLVFVVALPCLAQKPTKPTVKVDATFFTQKVQPILEKRCVGCHGAETQLSHLDLRSRENALKGGTRGAGLVPGSAAKSLMHVLLTGSRAPLMPPSGKLPASEIATLKVWVDGGAPWGSQASLASGQKQTWWSFKPLPPTSPPLRLGKGGEVDAFIAAKLKENKLSLSPPAPKRVLIRRVYADLWGLPPAPEEVEGFVRDTDPKAYEKLIEKLLASPRYGERWGRHWLDLARYADSGGFEGDKDRPLMFRYRDWVIAAFNKDLPYDEFVRLQIAGDELRPGDPSALIATGYLACGPQDIVENNARTRANEIDDLVATTSSVVLGLTVGCARCHDHKYDPVKMTDYYRLAAIFAPTERREVDIPGGKAQAVTDKGREFGPSFLLRRGDAYQPDKEIKPGFIGALPGGEAEVGAAAKDAKTTGRRAALAQWLTSKENPLTARVMVNRVWRQHFGRGIVASTSNFGLNGDLPTHPELLDWLAAKFIESGWSVKSLHRLILLSQTYQQASEIRPTAQQADPQNKLLWRMPVRRLEGEAVRDSLLTVAGTLNLEFGGPAVYPPIDPTLRADTFQGLNWPNEAEDSPKTWRRSVYVKVKRSLLLPQLEVFDCPEITYTVAQRNITTTPLQALMLLNDPLILRQAGLFAERLQRDRPSDTWAQIDRAYRLCFGRGPSVKERQLSLRFLRTRTLAEFCHTLFNLNEFVYVL
ncbi:PSD1 and planctomycete cytochrome C domain-containing protein [Armatimonas sp.]|uniref:PSD1 and planctomycete cytochrome C domain-containing protein n=1 Tax=Armatimonas sp. TaxID=1872638 RepID=UPI00286A7C4C|nr:PSD1 and planctomycete cytochrome C domain-containing protein [Armatimonas sp.]